jgi:hypothetical protein
MTPCVRVKPGVEFATIAPGGFVLLAAFQAAAHVLGHDLTITSGTDGAHSGDDDPHHLGRAYDLRTQGYDAQAILKAIMQELLADATDTVVAAYNGYVVRYFFGWIEDGGTANEHIHCQVRRGLDYPPATSAPTITT